MKENKGITLIALVITIIVLMILAGVTISMVLNGGIIEKAQTATEQYTIAQIKEEIENELVEIQVMILQQEKRIATLDDVEANFVAKGYPTKREVATAEQKETKIASLEVIQIADVNNVLKVGYKGYIATINTALKVTKVEEGELATSKTIGNYEIKSEEGENLTILITIENENGLESITYPDAPEDAILFADKRTITTKDIILQAEQEYEVKIKAVGEEEQSYKIIPTTKPTIQVTKTEIREETVENETIQKKVKTIEIEYSNNSNYENYYSIDNGITWIKYTGPIELTKTTEVMAKSVISGNGINCTSAKTKQVLLELKDIIKDITNQGSNVYYGSLEGTYDGREDTWVVFGSSSAEFKINFKSDISVSQIDITFSLDPESVVYVTAYDPETNEIIGKEAMYNQLFTMSIPVKTDIYDDILVNILTSCSWVCITKIEIF